ncbi:hypothetical protein CK503_03210 [Aliifodinibius salipaludis]|uniref:histidine kinase n=1 Tax=Fodinibius salipaludis TaxID=2032627 RepID=A0A2A2GEN3_9BACT|nr:ATP-binding protein [Aliifodinibius salipaludis]PAU95222.1 hypothetical protein CK503_03210 [Aliifodinibius salipaludis]
MNFLGIQKNQKIILIAAFVILFITIASFYLYRGVLRSEKEIIEDNKNITQTAVKKVLAEAEKDLTPVWTEYLEGKDKITKQDERVADSLLSKDVKNVLRNFHRLEGGLYFYELDEFIGYSFPTIEDPKPAFGPPPRSYNIIREQARKTIQKDTLLTELHQFDPAIFPLSTIPIYVDGKLIGAAWARIHIERKLAASQNIQSGTFFLTSGAILLGLFFTVLIVWGLRKRVQEIKEGLSKMKYDPSHRLKEYRGAFGVISKAINEMTDAQQEEQEKRKKLEKELFQKEKMATLGNLIAGTAHEINTPISIIKTRIQIWERKLSKIKNGQESPSVVSDKSLKLVHNEIERVSKLIKRLLLFSKPTVDPHQKIDVNSLLDEKSDWLKEAYPTHDITFQKDFQEDLPSIFGNKESIEHVLTNVLKNAVEASPEICQIVLSTSYKQMNDFLTVKVRDFGSGMPEKIKPKIFDPFFSTKPNGTGLGLSICNEIVKTHKGSIYFEKPDKENSILETWDDNTDTEQVKFTRGTICVIKLPVSDQPTN